VEIFYLRKHHIGLITGKAQKILNLLRRHLYGCNPDVKKRAFTALVLPFRVILRRWHLAALNVISQVCDQSTSVLRSCCSCLWSCLVSMVLYSRQNRLSYMLHYLQAKISCFVNAGSLSVMFNLKTSSKRQWKWYGWSSWFFCRSLRELWLFLIRS
jgi:hypothetical protein